MAKNTTEQTQLVPSLYREFWCRESKKPGDLAILSTNRKDDLKPYWRDEKEWLCTVEFLPTDDSEARLFAADIIGYLWESLPAVGGIHCLTPNRGFPKPDC